MTPERAAYHRLMLLAGLREEYDRELDHTLETADPITSPELDLAFCMSDLDETISVLYNYTLAHHIDQDRVYDMIITELRRLYAEKQLSSVQLVDIMYTMAQNCENSYAQPWYQLRYPSYEYESVEDGLISQEVFDIAFEAHFLHGERVDALALEKEHQKKNKKSLLDFFRKHKRKERPR